jgi:hypothetical protein
MFGYIFSSSSLSWQSPIGPQLGLLQWRIYVRHWHLVSNGEVVLGRITKNYGSARNGQYLRYQFNTQSGETLSKIRASWKGLDVGMRIPVFYDPYNPKKQVALFAAYYEVELRKQADARCRLTSPSPSMRRQVSVKSVFSVASGRRVVFDGTHPPLPPSFLPHFFVERLFARCKLGVLHSAVAAT